MKKLFLILFFYCITVSCAGKEPACYRDLADHFFDDDKAVMQALSLYHVTESSWTPIVHDVQKLSKHAFSWVNERARLLDSNPLDPFDPVAAEQLLENSMFDILQRVLNNYLITNQDDIKGMVDYIMRHHPGWEACFVQKYTERDSKLGF